MEEIIKLIQSGAMIEAIKAYRNRHYVSLLDAKHVCEKLRDNLKQAKVCRACNGLGYVES